MFIGTNNEGMRDPKQPGDRGVLMAFRESDGEFLWQHTSEKLAAGRVNDWPYQGVASSPFVEGDRLYYVSNRAKLTCIDIKGFSNGNDGPFKEEKFTGPKDADIIWEFDMMEEVGSHPHNLANSSPVSYGELIYVSTSNGQDESHVQHSVASRAVDHRDQQEDRQACLGRQLRRRAYPARPVVFAGSGQSRRCGATGQRPGRRLGARL